MAWCRSGDKPLSEPMMALFTDAYMRRSTSVSELYMYIHQSKHATPLLTHWPLENLNEILDM